MGGTKRRMAGHPRSESFRNAFRGIMLLLRNEINFRIHIVILVLVIAAGIFLRISITEWLVITAFSGLVLSAEGFNSAIEYLSDRVSPGSDESIRNTKDVAAAAVLLSSIAAAVAGMVIFLPKIIGVIQNGL